MTEQEIRLLLVPVYDALKRCSDGLESHQWLYAAEQMARAVNYLQTARFECDLNDVIERRKPT